ncbi:MAG: sugar phosphate isomerase/epimerase, partial [Planctomycetota bacterium]
LRGTAAALAGVAVGPQLAGAMADAKRSGLKISMCDWSMGCLGELRALEVAKKIGLDGVQVSLGKNEKPHMTQLRKPDLQKAYLADAKKYGVAVNSLAMGILNRIPLKSEPHTALWVADAIEVAKKLGASNMLLAFFGKGELDEKNQEEMGRITEVMKELAPRAEKAGVILGLENTISAEANLKIIKEVGSKYVQVYYDAYNLTRGGKDPIHEIKLLGNKNMCEIHFKEGKSYLGESGIVDWKMVVKTLKEIGYNKWITLETSSPNKDVIADTKRNMKYVRDLFAGV